MKIRQGFVSNSSSTSFTFCFKGDGIDDLCSMILKYGDDFRLSFDAGWGDEPDTRNCDAFAVSTAIKDVAKIMSVDDAIKEQKTHLKWIEDGIKGGTISDLLLEFYREDKIEIESRIKKLKDAKDRGLTSICIVGFGNDGEVSGDIGDAMDYEGRYIDIEEDDFTVMTEQNR